MSIEVLLIAKARIAVTKLEGQISAFISIDVREVLKPFTEDVVKPDPDVEADPSVSWVLPPIK